MSLSIAEIEHIATLARISLTEEEKKQYAAELSAVLEYMEILNEVDTAGVSETTQVTGLEDVVRDDVVDSRSEDMRKILIEAFPTKTGNLLCVKHVFDSTEE